MIAIRIMTAAHLSGIDLNLLVALDALLREAHVTRAAARIGLTQSAMSRSLPVNSAMTTNRQQYSSGFL